MNLKIVIEIRLDIVHTPCFMVFLGVGGLEKKRCVKIVETDIDPNFQVD